MFTQMVDQNTFMVGDRPYKAGDVIELTPDEEAALARVREIQIVLRGLKQHLINICHEADHDFQPEVRKPAHEFVGKSIELDYFVKKFLHDLQTRIGGLLPVNFKDEMTKIVVRPLARGPDGQPETFNYSIAHVSDDVGLPQIEHQRQLAIFLAGMNKRKVTIDSEVGRKARVQPVVAQIDPALVSNRKDLEDFVSSAVGAYLKRMLRPDLSVILFDQHLMPHVIGLNPSRPGEHPGVRWKAIVDYAKDLVGGPKMVCAVGPKTATQGSVTITTAIAYYDGGNVIKKSLDGTLVLENEEFVFGEWTDTFEIKPEERYVELLSKPAEGN